MDWVWERTFYRDKVNSFREIEREVRVLERERVDKGILEREYGVVSKLTNPSYPR